MNRSIIFCMSRAIRDAVAVALAGRPAVVRARVACLWGGDEPRMERMIVQFYLSLAECLYRQLVTIALGDPRHWKRMAPAGAQQIIPLFIISGNAQFALGFAIPRFQIVIRDRPVGHIVEPIDGFQAEIVGHHPRRIATPRPCGPANHALVVTSKDICLLRVGSGLLKIGPVIRIRTRKESSFGVPEIWCVPRFSGRNVPPAAKFLALYIS